MKKPKFLTSFRLPLQLPQQLQPRMPLKISFTFPFRLTLRTKILFALLMIPFVGLGSFLYMAKSIFTSDKIAYVFDSSLSVSKTRAARVKTEISSLISFTQSVVLTYSWETKALTESGNSFFERESRFEGFQLYVLSADGGSYDRVVDVAKESVKERLALETANLEPLVNKAKDREIWIHRSEKLPQEIVVFARFGKSDDPKHLIAISVFRGQDLSDTFADAGAYMSFLLHSSGDPLYSIPIPLHGGQQWQAGDVWKILSKTAVLEGTAEVSPPSDPESEFLASFAKVGVGDLVVVSVVNKGIALQAVELLKRKSALFFLAVLSMTVFISVTASNTMTRALSLLLDATKKIAGGDFQSRVDLNNRDEFGSLADSFNVMAGEVSRLMIETADKARMEGELATARTVQETLFPEASSEIGSVKIAGHYTPASECGGDWWYYCEIDGKIYIWIGDATGHGAPAALITSAARAVASVIQKAAPPSAAAAISLLNGAICDTSKGKMMMTFFLAVIDLQTGMMEYVNASHEAPMLLHKMEDQPSRDDYVLLNEVNNPRLGETVGHDFKSAFLQLQPGDQIVLYTDGVYDVKNLEEKPWGERKFIKTLSKSLHNYPNPTDSVKDVITVLWDYRQETALDDDVTLIVATYQGAA